jgi:hypothetical protein
MIEENTVKVIPMTLSRISICLRGLRMQVLLWTVLPVTILLIVFSLSGISSHQQSMQTLAAAENARLVVVLARLIALQAENQALQSRISIEQVPITALNLDQLFDFSNTTGTFLLLDKADSSILFSKGELPPMSDIGLMPGVKAALARPRVAPALERLAGGGSLPEHRNQPLDIVGEIAMTQFQGVAPGQCRDVLRQVGQRGHFRPAYQHRDDQFALPDGAGDFDTHEVIPLVEPPFAALIADRRPLRADDSDEDIAGSHRIIERLHEILAGFDAGDIHEKVFRGKVPQQMVIQATDIPFAVLAAVVDENAGHMLVTSPRWYGGALAATPA